jgi:aminoglycoside 3-N-acetyltransferase
MDPLFSIAASDALEKSLTGNLPKSCFGKNSFFDRFFRLNGKLLQIGISVDGTTFAIYFDQKLKSKYRYLKKFSGQIKIGDKLREETWTTYVRKLDGTVNVDLKNLKDRVEEDGYIKKAPLMDSFIYSIEIKTLFEAVKRYVKEDPLFFLKH